MVSFIILGLYVVGLEILRRFILTLVKAYTGPLSKIPGPFWNKFSIAPVVLQNMQSTQCRDSHWRKDGVFGIYGPVVRICKSLNVSNRDRICSTKRRVGDH
jgi:hypothetical protein